MPGERENYIDWESFFMYQAILASERSKDPRTQVGACIVKDHKTLSIGYNGTVAGMDDHIDMPWHSNGEATNDIMQIKNTFVYHAEANAIDNYFGIPSMLQGSTIYVTLFPCLECTKRIIQKGIKRVVYLELYKKADQMKASMYMLEKAGVIVEKFENINQIKDTSEKISNKIEKLENKRNNQNIKMRYLKRK